MKTKEIYKNIVLYVCETEEDEYRKNNPEIEVHPMRKGVQGNIARVRNYILEKEFEKNGKCVIMDDDFSGLMCHENGKEVMLDEDTVHNFIDNGFTMCDDLGARLWGVNVLSDPKAYRIYTPLSMKGVILGPFSCHLQSNVRYDERIPLKEDYDYYIQQMNVYKKVLRFNKYFYRCKQSNLKGGCSSMRNREEEERQFCLLEKKWGTGIIKRDIKKQDYNPIIKIPIRGV